jgi:hypothetical protein
MQLWKNPRKSNLTKVLQIVSLIFAAIAFVGCFALSYKYYGFDQGFFAAKELDAELYKNLLDAPIKTSLSVEPGVGQYVGNKYYSVALLLAAFSICHLAGSKINHEGLRGKITAIFFNISLLGLSLYVLQQMIQWKSMLLENSFSTDCYHILFQQSNFWDWSCLSIIIILLAIQLAELSASFFAASKK